MFTKNGEKSSIILKVFKSCSLKRKFPFLHSGPSFLRISLFVPKVKKLIYYFSFVFCQPRIWLPYLFRLHHLILSLQALCFPKGLWLSISLVIMPENICITWPFIFLYSMILFLLSTVDQPTCSPTSLFLLRL